jgi:hypothetical protein
MFVIKDRETLYVTENIINIYGISCYWLVNNQLHGAESLTS